MITVPEITLSLAWSLDYIIAQCKRKFPLIEHGATRNNPSDCAIIASSRVTKSEESIRTNPDDSSAAEHTLLPLTGNSMCIPAKTSPGSKLPAGRGRKRRSVGSASGRVSCAGMPASVSCLRPRRQYALALGGWWGEMELRHRPTAYQAAALTAELPPHKGRLIRGDVSMSSIVPNPRHWRKPLLKRER